MYREIEYNGGGTNRSFYCFSNCIVHYWKTYFMNVKKQIMSYQHYHTLKSNLEDTKTNFIDSNLFCFGTCQTKILQFYVFQSGQCKNKAGENMHSNM